MVYRGKVHNGQIVIDGAPRLAEGTELRIEPIVPTEPRIGSPEAIRSSAGIWANEADEVDRLLAELKEMKAEELRRQLEEPEPEL